MLLVSIIIITNKNKIATAPTYIIKSNKAINSHSNKNSIPVEEMKHNIKKRTE